MMMNDVILTFDIVNKQNDYLNINQDNHIV